MAEVKLNAKAREGRGKGAARQARMAGKVPGVVYGRGMEPVPIEVDRREFITALNTDAGMNVLLELQLDGKQVLTLARELQRDPVRGILLHADLVNNGCSRCPSTSSVKPPALQRAASSSNRCSLFTSRACRPTFPSTST